MIKHTWAQLSESTRQDCITEQGIPGPDSQPGADLMATPMQGGQQQQQQQGEQSDEEKLFLRFTQYGQIDEFIQLMRMEGWGDEHILGKLKKKFYPEFVYWARQGIMKNAEQSRKVGMQRQAADADFDGIPDAIDI